MPATWRDFQRDPDSNTAAPPIGAPEGNYRGSVVNDTFRYDKAAIRDLGETTLKIDTGEGAGFSSESIAGTMALQSAAAVQITGGSITGAAGSVPIGAIMPFSGTTPSTTVSEAAALEAQGWAICDGRTVSGRTTPDLRGLFLRGWSSTITPAATGGDTSATTSSGGTHDHGLTDGAQYVGSGEGSAFVSAVSGGTLTNHKHATNTAGAHTHTVATLPPWYAVVYIQRVA